MRSTAFTIASRNYFAYTKTLGNSLRTSNPDLDYHILIVDRKDPEFEAKNPGWKITWVEDLGIDNFEHVAFKYDILELNTNVKPTFAKKLLDSYENVIYLDPDIFVYHSLSKILDLLKQHAVILTPHITVPIIDQKLPGEAEFLNSGIYNLGFAAFNSSDESLALLSWWEQRCLESAFNEQERGFFVDQKWMDFVPSLCASAFVLRDRQYNMAYWNLHERIIESANDVPLVDGKPLVFFHFSGLPPVGDDRVSKYQTRFNLPDRPDIAPLFEAYRSSLAGHGHDLYLKYKYGFGSFSNGVAISSVARRVAAGLHNFLSTAAPFDANGPVFTAMLASKLIGTQAASTKIVQGASLPSSSEAARLDKLAAAIFRMLLRVFGPLRYERLMRYIGRKSSLRSQSFLLRRDL
jgi:hypothetical protein